MAAPLTDDERQQIVELCEQGLSCKAIADQVGRSPDTVSRVARAAGHRFGHTNLVRARETRSAYCAERRATAASKAQETLERILDEFFDERQQVVTTYGRDGGTKIVEVEPDAKALADLAKAVHTLQRTVLDISRHDEKADEGASDVDDWLRHQMGPSVQGEPVPA